MQVKYIGDHIKTDSIDGVGLRWEPGQQRDVTSTVAAHLLAYKDTWVKGDEESDKTVPLSQDVSRVEAGDKPEPIDFLEKDKRPDEPVPVVNFHAMNKEQLEKFAEDNQLGKMNKRWGEQTVREHITRMWTEQKMNEG